ncbi:sla2 Src-like adaptor 2 [Globomyces sp. JEL0801]|nr:sla2 Src-like adaptor 2 [Globomyces sp. JEL0801]
MSWDPYRSSKQEDDLAMALKKALTPDETAPKQKHVRAMILYTWDMKGSGSVWNALKTFPMMSDDIIVFKALITFHKIARQGHPNALKDAVNEIGWLDQLQRQTSDYGGGGRKPYFSGTFDYEEYVSLKGIEDPNEGFETIFDLLQLLEQIDRLQKLIFNNLRSFGNNEGKIAVLVPLVEESYGIYQFITSMMTAMHTIIGSVEVLEPLRDSFRIHHNTLVRFYDDCSQIKFLTSLISIPKLSSTPPNFLAQGPPKQAPKKPQRNENDIRREQELERERRYREEQEMLERQEQERLQLQQQMESQREAELRRMQEEQERLRLQMQQQEQYNMQAKLMDSASQLTFLQQQSQRDREMLQQYDMKVQQLTQEVNRLNLLAGGDLSKDAQINQLNSEINQWKTKYDALAKLYAQLRKEHLDLLTKFKTMKDSGNKVSDDARRQIEKAQADLKAKSNELTDVLVERNRLKGDADRIRLQYETEISRLKTEIEQSKQALNEMSATRGSEVQNLVGRFTAEQSKLEDLLRAKQTEISQLTLQLGDVLSAMEKSKMSHEEETLVLQAGLDQALEILRQHQEEAQSGLVTRDERIGILEGKHQQLLNQMMDNVLSTCVTTVSEALFLLGTTSESTSKISPEIALSLIEKCQQKCTEFCTSVVKLVNGGDPKDAITTGASLAQSVAQLLNSGTEMQRLCKDDEEGEQIIEYFRHGGQSCVDFFQQVKSDAMIFVEGPRKAEYVVNLSRTCQHQVSKVSPLLEGLVTSKMQGNLQGDLTDAVEREMASAAKAIEEAAQKLQLLLNKQGPDLNVNSAILQAAVALTTAISQLIKCATVSQQEIVAQSKGTTTATAFYKKNNKWTEGLISAAQAVAQGTVYLVQIADGLVQGKNSWEQLVVAAQDVGVSTTQLVSAARVKASLYSPTQTKLETAAVAVREATKLLVKAAKDASKLSDEQNARQQVGKMSKHEAKVAEMEQQVKILELEKALGTARYTLGEMRKAGYHEE